MSRLTWSGVKILMQHTLHNQPVNFISRLLDFPTPRSYLTKLMARTNGYLLNLYYSS